MEGILCRQIYSNDKCGVGYSKFDKPSTSKTIFVKVIDESNKQKINRVQNVHYLNHYVLRYRINFVPTCFYCGLKGYTPNTCYVRNFSIAGGYYVWVKK